MKQTLAITECPRDAMQGIIPFIPTEWKVQYLNALLRVGFDRLDFGSFVSPKAIPQMRDTAEVLDQLDWAQSDTELLAIVPNQKGGEMAVMHEGIQFLGYPFSISETFQQRNTHSSIADSLKTVQALQDIAQSAGKKLLVYLSMGFGNPYGDPYSEALVSDYLGQLLDFGVRHVALSDTIGIATPDQLQRLLPVLQQSAPDIELGLHLHSTPDTSVEKLEAALAAGATRFDTALKGLGGCPMAKDELTGNIATETLVELARVKGWSLPFNEEAWQEAWFWNQKIFNG
jgi:hydroxymethylglutaryl-CoA lyase